jgi:hypothetical protein
VLGHELEAQQGETRSDAEADEQRRNGASRAEAHQVGHGSHVVVALVAVGVGADGVHPAHLGALESCDVEWDGGQKRLGHLSR